MAAKDVVENTSVEMEWVPDRHLLSDVLTKDMPMNETFQEFHETTTLPEPKQGGGCNRGTQTVTSTAGTTALEHRTAWRMGKECRE